MKETSVPAGGSTPAGSGRFNPGRLVVPGILVLAILYFVLHRPSPAPAPQPGPYSVGDKSVDIKSQSPTRTYVTLAQAERGSALLPEPVPGRVALDESRAAPIFAPLPGRVDKVAVRLGQRVAQGERLVAIRSAAFVDLLHEIDTLRASEAVRQKTVERLQSLVQLKASAEKDLLSAQLELSEARLSRQAAELRLRARPIEASTDGTAYWLLAPRGGVVVERQVLESEEVSPDRTNPLFVIAEIDEVIVTADVPEHDVASIKVGEQAKIQTPVDPGNGFDGTVEYVSEVVDPVRRMINVRIRVPNPERTLRPNAFVQVTFSPSREAPVVVPAGAVVTEDQDSFVFVTDPAHPDRFVRRPVVPGRQTADKVELLSGLEPGETYVARGALLLLNAVDLAQ